MIVKKLWNVLLVTLALNFMALAGGVGWLYSNGNLDKAKVVAIKDLVFPKPVPEVPATQPAVAQASTQPTLKLEELLARQVGRPATEQVEFIQQTFDSKLAELDRRRRELQALEAQVEQARKGVAKDRAALLADEAKLISDKQQATRLASDKGFQDSLALYTTLPAKAVKTIFTDLDDQTVMQYLQTMQPRIASRIVKEFKSAEEVKRIERVMEMMRMAGTQAIAKD
jgi:hypothetical protein